MALFRFVTTLNTVLLSMVYAQYETIWSDNFNSNNGWTCNNAECDFAYTSSRCPDADSPCHRLAGGLTYAIRSASISAGYSALRFQFDIHANNIENGDRCAVFSRYDGSGSWSLRWEQEGSDAELANRVATLPSPVGHYSVQIRIEVDGDGDSTGKKDRCYWDDGVLSGIRATPNPTHKPTQKPTSSPTRRPTLSPTPAPTINPTPAPTINPTPAPTNNPTMFGSPTKSPTSSTNYPSKLPTYNPTLAPTLNPTLVPTNNPSNVPSNGPTKRPTDRPTSESTNDPSAVPTNNPAVDLDLSSTSGSDSDALTTQDELNTDLYIIVASILVLLGCVILFIIIYCQRRKLKEKNMLVKIKSQELQEKHIQMASTDTNVIHTTSVVNSGDSSSPGVVTLETWLNKMGIMEYYDIFKLNGFESYQSRLFLDNSILKEIGISKVGHRKLILRQVKTDIEDTQNFENVQKKEEGLALNKANVADINLIAMPMVGSVVSDLTNEGDNIMGVDEHGDTRRDSLSSEPSLVQIRNAISNTTKWENTNRF